MTNGKILKIKRTKVVLMPFICKNELGKNNSNWQISKVIFPRKELPDLPLNLNDEMVRRRLTSLLDELIYVKRLLRNLKFDLKYVYSGRLVNRKQNVLNWKLHS